MKKRIYAAYGSNMDTLQMEKRTDSTLLAKAILRGYRLEFCGNKRGNNYATIVKDENSIVPILLWLTSAKDEYRLDWYEGYPDFYRKEILSLDDIDIITWYGVSKMSNPYVYIMNSDRLGAPGREYFLGIYDAYLKYGFYPGGLLDAYKRAAGESFRFF